MSMQAKDFIAVFEYMKAFNKPPKAKAMKKDKTFSEMIYDLENRKREVKVIEGWLEEQAKLMKKEEKKDEKKGWWQKLSLVQQAAVIAVFGPPLSLIYVSGLIVILKVAVLSLR